MSTSGTRHILSLSGGKDSAALAVYLRDRVPDVEYVFCDTEKELPETYEFLSRLEAYLGRPITTLKHDGRGFDHWLTVYGNYLPSARMRWCTKHLKLQPFEQHVGSDEVINYIGIRADEDREGYISHKPNVKACYPFHEDGITKEDVFRILDEAGLGLPDYYKWRSRSGCYFCFFQQKIEWIGLLENHPHLFDLAKAHEKTDSRTGKNFTWQKRESLEELSKPERVLLIKQEHRERVAAQANRSNPARGGLLVHVFADLADEECRLERPCLICQT